VPSPRHGFEWLGQSKAEIQTPALLIDGDVLDENLKRGADQFTVGGLSGRPHTKTHKSTIIAARQLELGAGGVCCAKPSEAEVMVRAGIRDVLVTAPVVDPAKLALLATVAEEARLALVVDNAEAIGLLATAAAQPDVTIDVLIEVDVGQNRCGVRSTEAAVQLARSIAEHDRLHFRGLQGYNGAIQLIPEFTIRAAGARDSLQRLQEAAEAIRAEGLPVEVLTGGGTGTSMIDPSPGGLTEIQPGSYVFMDATYAGIEWAAGGDPSPFRPALSVLATVVSRPSRDLAILDVGWKAASMDSGVPAVVEPRGFLFSFAGDELGCLRPSEGMAVPDIGARVEVRPSHCDTTVNLYDEYLVLRNGVVEDVWPIDARGMTR
jgi:3-hydroxy-D-aspartate aldolase